MTLDKLRKQPQFIDAVFSAKADRTKMEEEPVENVPDPETDNNLLLLRMKRLLPEKKNMLTLSRKRFMKIGPVTSVHQCMHRIMR
jgi:hypothetical protein